MAKLVAFIIDERITALVGIGVLDPSMDRRDAWLELTRQAFNTAT